MAEAKKSFGRRQVFQMLALFLFLIALPAGSWYYLRTGLNYRIEALEELGDHGLVPDFEWYTAGGDTLRRDDLKGGLVVASFFDPAAGALATTYGDNLRRLHEQFGRRSDILFLQYAADSAAAGQVESFERTYDLAGAEQCYFLTHGRPGAETLAREGYGLPLDAATSLRDNPYLALADTNLTIRRYYDLRDAADVKRLVAHIALLMPREREENPVLVREAEK